MDPTEAESHHSPTKTRENPELGFRAPYEPDPEPSDHPDHRRRGLSDEAAWEGEEVEVVREELEEHLHLEVEAQQEEEEEEKKGGEEGGWGSNYNFNDNYNGWDEGERVNGGWDDWGGEFKEEESAKEATWGVDIEEVEEKEGVVHYDSGQRSNGGFGGGGSGGGKFPVRPGADDCSFYMKTGTCKFGSGCKFNHPVRRRSQPAKERVKDTEETTERPGQLECKYYLRTGGCKYGDTCRFSHSKVKAPGSPSIAPVYPIAELNFLNLPIRPGEKACPYYMRNGSCKYGANCRFHHPDPSPAGGSEPPSAFNNGGSSSMYTPSKSNISSWTSPRALNDAGSYMPMMFPPAQAIGLKNPEWNGYPAPAYSQERGVQIPAYAINSPVTESNAYGHQQQPNQVDEFPERPGQPDCSYFMKTGDCKFKSNCKYNHPKNRAPKPPPCALSDKGLPLRPDQTVCAYYSRYGICKYGPACKFNHPIQPASNGSPEDQPSPYIDSTVEEEARVSGSGNDNTIQQAV